MAHAAHHKPSKVFRGTVEEVFSRRDEIPSNAMLELKIFESDPSTSASERDQSSTSSTPKAKKLRGYGMLAGVLSVDDYLKRKHEDTLIEDRSLK